MAQKMMLWSVKSDLMVTVERAFKGIPDAEWQEYIAAHKEMWRQGDFRLLVHSDGTGPNAKQRGYAVENGWGKSNSPIAVLTDSLLVRSVLTAFAWFGVKIAGFSPKDPDAAFRYLHLTDEEKSWATAENVRLRQKLASVVAAEQR